LFWECKTFDWRYCDGNSWEKNVRYTWNIQGVEQRQGETTHVTLKDNLGPIGEYIIEMVIPGLFLSFRFLFFPNVPQYVFTIIAGAVNQARPIIGVTALEPHFCFRMLIVISVVLDSFKIIAFGGSLLDARWARAPVGGSIGGGPHLDDMYAYLATIEIL
jgi:hypothetical protein